MGHKGNDTLRIDLFLDALGWRLCVERKVRQGKARV
jgi:hypothetical protein